MRKRGLHSRCEFLPCESKMCGEMIDLNCEDYVETKEGVYHGACYLELFPPPPEDEDENDEA